MSAEWPEILFIKFADLYLAQLEALLERAEAGVDAFLALFPSMGSKRR